MAAPTPEQERLEFTVMNRGGTKGTSEFKNGIAAALPERTLKTIEAAEASSL